jgi:sugar fermentation stimulation protein A
MHVSFTFASEPALFLERPNRFRVHARLASSGVEVRAHCPNPGRLRELLLPGQSIVWVSPAQRSERATAWDLRFVENPITGELISLDTRLPNALAAAGLATGFFPELWATSVQAEVVMPLLDGRAHRGPRSRIDFLLNDRAGKRCWLEVKSVSLVEGTTALFPDAPTERGRRHLQELAARRAYGERAAVLFLIQRSDAAAVQAHAAMDPAFALAMAEAAGSGVEFYGVTTQITPAGARLAKMIPVYPGRASPANMTDASRA